MIDRADIPQPDAASSGLRRTVGGHDYYQDTARPLRFYYLPDYYDLDADNGTPAFLKVRRTGAADEFQVDNHAVPWRR